MTTRPTPATKKAAIELLKNPEQLWEAFRKSKEQFADLTSPPELDERILRELAEEGSAARKS